MSIFKRKKKDDEEIEKEEVKDDKLESSEEDNSQYNRSDASHIPQELRDTLAKFRKDQETPGYEDVEVKDGDDDVDENKDDDSTNPEGDDQKVDDDLSEDDPGKDSSKSEDEEEQPEYEEINPRLVEAGRAMGLTDEKIRTIADTDESILADFATRLEKKDIGHRQDKEEVKEDDVTIDEADIEKMREKIGDEGVKLLLGFQKENATLREKFAEIDEFKKSNVDRDAQNESHRKAGIADKYFDEKPELFGVTKKLTKYPDGSYVTGTPHMVAREDVYRVALMFHEKNGGSFDAAMTEALQWKTGSTKKQDIARDIVKDVNNQRKRFSVKPTQRKVKRVFKDANSKKSFIVKEAAREAGLR